MTSESTPERNSEARSIKSGRCLLQRRVAEIEIRISAGVDALGLEISQMMRVLELLLRRELSWPTHVRSGGSAPLPGDDVARFEGGRRGANDWSGNGGYPRCREIKRGRPAPLRNGDVHRLHYLLLGLSPRTIDAPGRYRNAPGYYAVYFTDETNGLEVEYVHTGKPRR